MTAPARPPLTTHTPGSPFRQYILLEQIGIGGQGVVWSALDPAQKRIYAIKFSDIPEDGEEFAEDARSDHHLQQLIKLHHSHILPFHEFGSDTNARFSVSPYIPGGTLLQKIRTTSLHREAALRYGMEIASALDYLHSQGVIHRDLKSSNILLDLSDHTYLADFGLARILSTSTLAFHTGHGTPPYAPPEQNRLTEITPRSDIFSFGILLFEIFTGQLPWNGKKQLGMEQLHSDQELPDPCEVNSELPARLVDVLRRTTSASPELRPRSAGEVMRAIYYVFGIPYQPLDNEKEHDEQAARKRDVQGLLRHGLEQWKSTEGMYNLGLTRFALVDLERRHMDLETFGGFLLFHALTYGYRDEQWWAAVSDPRERLEVSSQLLKKGNEAIAVRVLQHLIGDMEIRSFSKGLPEGTARPLLTFGAHTTNTVLRRRILLGLKELTQPGNAWSGRVLSLGEDQQRQLGELALEDSKAGDAAAELIGHLRATPAAQVIVDSRDEERKVAALLLIQQAAGSMPDLVQGGLRLRLSLEGFIQRLAQQPISLFGVYMMAAFGAALGVGVQVYLTYNWPDFLDTARITTSLIQGLITGAVFGLGVFMVRVIVERFPALRALRRVLAGTVVGAVVMNIALLVFHVLFLTTPPHGFLITGGCFLIALSFAAGSLTRSYLFKAFLSSLSVLAVVTGTWWLHLNYAASPVELAPLFRYDYAWSLMRVTLTALGFALPVGMMGNLVDLSLKDE